MTVQAIEPTSITVSYPYSAVLPNDITQPIVQLPQAGTYTNSAGAILIDTSGLVLIKTALLDLDVANNYIINAIAEELGDYGTTGLRMVLADGNNGNIYVESAVGDMLSVVIPYPTGYTKTDSFKILHFLEGSDLTDPFDYSTYEIFDTDDNGAVRIEAGIKIEVDSFSPFIVGATSGEKTITASAELGGTITPSGPTTVTRHTDQTFTITANPGYSIKEVFVDDISVGVVNSYTYSSVVADHSIRASFVINSYDILATAGSNGSITNEGVTTVEHGTSLTYTMIPNAGYVIDKVLIDSVNVGSIGEYTFNNIASGHTIAVSFIKSNSPSTGDKLDVIWVVGLMIVVSAIGIITFITSRLTKKY